MSYSPLDYIAAQTALLVPLSSVSDGSGYGIDLICTSDLDSRMGETLSSGILSLAQDLFHRVTTPRLGLVDDADWGIDIRGKLSVGQTPQQIQALQAQIEIELARDDRVSTVSAQVVVGGTRLDSWAVTIQITPLDAALNSFSLVLAVTNGQALLDAINQAPK